MNKILCILSLIALSIISCGKQIPVKSTCHIDVVSPMPDYAYAVLFDHTENHIDTLVFNQGKAAVEITDTLDMPYIGYLRFYNPADRKDVIELPIAVEGGKVSVDLSSGISLGGTPLNDRLHAFLVERAKLGKSLDPQTHPDVTVEQLRSAYSSFYKEQILNNKSNIIGDFLIKNYSVHLLPADEKEIR